MTALVMAGGRGRRLKAKVEKPLLDLCGKPLICWVLDALKKSLHIGSIVVVTSIYTPETSKVVGRLGFKVLEAPGKGYLADIHYAVKKLRLKGPVMVTSADLPLLKSKTVSLIIEHFMESGKPALSVMVPLSRCTKLGFNPDLTLNINGKTVVPAGINILTAEMIDLEEIPEEKLILELEELAVNINTMEDLKNAERALYKALRTGQ